MGNNENINIFTKTNITNAKQIVNGRTETIVLKNDGTVWGTGFNERGELGIGNTEQQNTFKKAQIENVEEIKCEYSTIIAKTKEGKYYGWGMNNKYQLGLNNNEDVLLPQELPYEDVKEIYAGGQANVFIIKKDGTLWGCGGNNFGHLAQGNFQEYYTDFVKIDFIK